MKGAWPSMMRTLYGDHKKFYDIYFSLHKGYYFTGNHHYIITQIIHNYLN
jgi:acetyl-CoA synthetase